MLGYILKFFLFLLMVMVILNIFAPEHAANFISLISEYTDINEETLKNSLDKVTQFTKDTLEEVSQKIQETFEK